MFVLGYVLGDPWEEKQSCTQDFIPFNCFPHFSLLGGCWGCSKTLMWFLDSWSYTVIFRSYEFFDSRLATMMHWNVVLTIFHTQQICYHAWKTVIITFQSIIVLQLQGDLSRSIFLLFRAFSLLLKDKDTDFFVVFHTWLHICCGWKIVKTTFLCIVVFQLQGDCPWMYENFI